MSRIVIITSSCLDNLNGEGRALGDATGKFVLSYVTVEVIHPVRDILSELATAGNVSLSSPRTESAPHNKRPRDSDTPAQPCIYPSSSPNIPRAIAGPRRLSAPALDPSTHSGPPNYALPMYSTELGRLPVYGQFSFSDSRAYPASAAFNANVDYTAFDVPVPGFTNTPVQTFDNEPSEWNAQTLHQESSTNGGTALAYPALSNLDTMPMDSDTMTMWSTAPAGFE